MNKNTPIKKFLVASGASAFVADGDYVCKLLENCYPEKYELPIKQFMLKAVVGEVYNAKPAYPAPLLVLARVSDSTICDFKSRK